jgi:tRNA uridine 5-carboxymethylaminomethyl modification enzyme
VGLLSQEHYDRFCEKQATVSRLRSFCDATQVFPTATTNAALAHLGSAPLKKSVTVSDLVRRPELDIGRVLQQGIAVPPEGVFGSEVLQQVETDIKFHGYLAAQAEEVDRLQRLEQVLIPKSFDYDDVPSLSREIVEKLNRVRPASLGHAMRISGVTPAAISVLMVHLRVHAN